MNLRIKELHEKVLYPEVRVRAKERGGSGTVIYSQPHPEREDEYETYILTCWHVIEELIEIEKDYFDPVIKAERPKEVLAQAEVSTFDYAWLSHVDSSAGFRADIVAYDKEHDLALLRLDSPSQMPYVAELYPKNKERNIKLFDEVWVSGCSLGHDPICNKGILTYKEELIEGKKYWMCNASSIFGNSGGAVFLDRTMQLIGVPARITGIKLGWGVDIITWMGFLIPIYRIYEFLDEQVCDFIYNPERTSIECFEERKQRQEAARRWAAEQKKRREKKD